MSAFSYRAILVGRYCEMANKIIRWNCFIILTRRRCGEQNKRKEKSHSDFSTELWINFGEAKSWCEADWKWRCRPWPFTYAGHTYLCNRISHCNVFYSAMSWPIKFGEDVRLHFNCRLEEWPIESIKRRRRGAAFKQPVENVDTWTKQNCLSLKEVWTHHALLQFVETSAPPGSPFVETIRSVNSWNWKNEKKFDINSSCSTWKWYLMMRPECRRWKRCRNWFGRLTDARHVGIVSRWHVHPSWPHRPSHLPPNSWRHTTIEWSLMSNGYLFGDYVPVIYFISNRFPDEDIIRWTLFS